MRSRLPTLACAVALLLGCGSKGEQQAEGEPSRADLARVERAADALGEELAERLFSALEESGPLGAIEICSQVAQGIAQAHSRDGQLTQRVGLRVRNPANWASGMPMRQLEEWEREMARGKTPRAVSMVATVATEGTLPPGNSELWYLRPLLIARPCLICHGDSQTMDPDLVARLGEIYPEDEAVGYKLGDLRGAIWVRLGLDGQQELPALGPARSPRRHNEDRNPRSMK